MIVNGISRRLIALERIQVTDSIEAGIGIAKTNSFDGDGSDYLGEVGF